MNTSQSLNRIHEIVTLLAGSAGDRAVLRGVDGAISGNEIIAALDATEAALARHGVRSGDRVMLVGENAVSLLLLILGVSRLDAVSVIVNARMTGPEVARIAGHCEPRCLIFTSGASEAAAAHATAWGTISLDIGWPGANAATPVTDSTPDVQGSAADDALAVLLYTSGTTGMPKGVALSHANLLFTARTSCRVRGIGPRDRVLAVLPVSHVFGLASVFLGTMQGGGELVLMQRFDAATVARFLAEDGITIFQGVPAMFSRLLELSALRDAPLPAPDLRYISTGGAPLALSVKRRVEAMWGLPLCNGYGLTETTAGMCMTSPSVQAEDDSVGVPFPDIEVRIADPATGEAVSDGAVGEFQVRGPCVMRGYYRAAEETAKVLSPDGWFRTGDFAWRGPNGHYYIAGRLKELIIRSGFNVYPVEVETILNTHPDVALTAVVGRPTDDRENEEVVAFVQPVKGRTIPEAGLRALAARELAPYKRPARYVFEAEIPVTPAGKIIKAALKDRAAALKDKEQS